MSKFSSRTFLNMVLICPHIFLTEGEVALSRNEKILVCGKEDSEAWKEIPLSQSEYHLKIIFQEKGYYNSQFKRENGKLYIQLGRQSEVKSWNVQNFPPEINPSKKRKIVGHPLTPEKLNEAEQWLENELKSQGYACPVIESEAQIWTETFENRFVEGQRLKVGSISRQGLGSLEERALLRFESYETGQWYDNRKLQITTNRLLQDGLAQSSYFSHACEPVGVQVTHHLQIGKPRILRFGIGASNEEFPFVDVWFKNTQLDSMASSFWVMAHLSPILQSVELSSELFILPRAFDVFFGPRARFAREDEKSYQVVSSRVGADLGRYWDWRGQRFSSSWGPTVNNVQTLKGFGPDNVYYLSFEGHLSWMNHDYELLVPMQSTGHQFSIRYLGQRVGLGAPVSADQVSFRWKKLFNLRGYSPPFLVLGIRSEAQATTSENIEHSQDSTLLPAEYRIFLGGERNLRGFSRQSIHRDQLGYLTSFYLGTEIRLIEELPWNLEPLLLWDFAKVGAGVGTFDEPIFQSYGAGIRWRSPLGPVRFTAARGTISHADDISKTYPEEWVFAFSFGREF